MNAPAKLSEVTLKTIEFKLDAQTIHAFEGETILKAAKRHGVDIPHLCYKDGYRADGNCRACVVEIKGERTLAPSCCRSATEGMEVQAHSERAVKSQKMVLEMLLSDMPDVGYKWNDASASGAEAHSNNIGQHGELSLWAEHLNVSVRPELKALRREQPKSDMSHPAMAVNLDACIQCNRCVRACREEQVNDVIGYAMRGSHSEIVFDLHDPMGDSTCVACGECVQACPT
ncbi:MAG: (2Fe-2S)-binding protein, partial [Rhodoferax sp.]|nr:(2Fe-2S)-binding protein [Rhodoferax sp.]